MARTSRGKSFPLAALCIGLVATIAPAGAQMIDIAQDGIVREFGAATPKSQPAKSKGCATLADAFEKAATRHDLSVYLLMSVAEAESRCNARAKSPAGAMGVMQLMPETARSFGVDPWDAAQNIEGGAAYLRAQIDRFDGRIDLALAAYNAGPGSVDRSGGVPAYAETRGYIKRNLNTLADISLNQGSK